MTNSTRTEVKPYINQKTALSLGLVGALLLAAVAAVSKVASLEVESSIHKTRIDGNSQRIEELDKRNETRLNAIDAKLDRILFEIKK